MQPQILIAAAGDSSGALPLSPRFRRLAASRVGARHTRMRDLCREARERRAPVADGSARSYARPARTGCGRPIRNGAPTRPRQARRPPRPALPRRVGADRLAGGRRGPRPGDVRARALAPALPAQRGRPRLPAARAAQHVPEPQAQREGARAGRAAARRARRARGSACAASRRPRSRPASSTPPWPRCRRLPRRARRRRHRRALVQGDGAGAEDPRGHRDEPALPRAAAGRARARGRRCA